MAPNIEELEDACDCTACTCGTPILDKCTVETWDAVNHPSHYTAYPMEVKDMVKLLLNAMPGLTPYEYSCLGQEFQYRLRAGLKKGVSAQEDIDKAMQFKKFREESDLDDYGNAGAA